MPKRTPARVREQVVVYLDARDRALLEQLTKTMGLAKTEVFRRGLRRLADDASARTPGFSLRELIASADDDDFPPDLSERPDSYFYGREDRAKPKKRARSR